MKFSIILSAVALLALSAHAIGGEYLPAISAAAESVGSGIIRVDAINNGVTGTVVVSASGPGVKILALCQETSVGCLPNLGNPTVDSLSFGAGTHAEFLVVFRGEPTSDNGITVEFTSAGYTVGTVSAE
jgi:hypothetical protein